MSTLAYFLISGAVIFVMMRFGCGAHVMGHGHRLHGAKSDSSLPTNSAGLSPPLAAVDPVCGMAVSPAGSKSAVYDGHAYYFCSRECREKFEASPNLYTGSSANPPQIVEHTNEHRH